METKVGVLKAELSCFWKENLLPSTSSLSEGFIINNKEDNIYIRNTVLLLIISLQRNKFDDS